MAADLALYVLADPLHAAIILASAPGSGFDDDHAVACVEFRFRGPGPWKQEALDKATARDAQVQPLLDDLRRRASESLKDLPADRTVRGSTIPLSRLPGDKLKAMGMADRALLERMDADMPEQTRLYEYIHRAFVIDADMYGMLIGHAERAGVDVDNMRQVLDAGFGRVATILAE